MRLRILNTVLVRMTATESFYTREWSVKQRTRKRIDSVVSKIIEDK